MSDKTLWEGTTQELLTNLEENLGEADMKRRRDWPVNSTSLSKKIRRVSPNLRHRGIEVSFYRNTGKDRRRIIKLEKRDFLASDPSEASETAFNEEKTVLISDASDSMAIQDQSQTDKPLPESNGTETETDDILYFDETPHVDTEEHALEEWTLGLSASDLPPAPFRLRQEAKVINTRGFLKSLQAQIRCGPSHVRWRNGALQRDLRDLKNVISSTVSNA